ncbi:MAG TPA: S41 family peptidase [Rubrivivax sp.]|nr:S41 family peptidase [Rubrivivax sp.]
MRTPHTRSATRALRTGLAAAALALLAACGGGDDDDAPAGPAVCSVGEHRAWLADYMDEWYFWYRLAPRPDPDAYADVESYFQARLYAGGEAAFPADRWSRSESTESFNRFYGDGATLGYGVAVAGLEVEGQPARPLFVRHVEPRSPAAAQGIRRGDEVLAIDGRSAAERVASGDFAALSALAVGDRLTLQLRRSGQVRSVTLAAAIFALTPVEEARIYSTPGSRRIGVVVVKDMIPQALDPLASVFTRLRDEGVDDVVLDLRYNGGGLVSTGAMLASHVAGTRGEGRTYATLLYNDRRAGNNQTFAFERPAAALTLPRVFVLVGRRTCSAAEQVINGLRGIGIDVIAIGETSCGKPVGSLPASACGRTYSVVNFESVNARFEGRYFDGFDATCAVAEDFTEEQASTFDPLVVAAAHFADQGVCPPATGVAKATRRGAAGWRGRSDERETMLPR